MAKHYPFELQALPYDYEALSPVISAETLMFHHDKHLQTYVDNLNKALENYPDYHHWSLDELILKNDQLPEAIRTAVRNNAGGVYNHQMYFHCMAKPNGMQPRGELACFFEKAFHSYDAFKKQMKETALSQFGSGWAWLVADDKNELHLVKTPNQDTPHACGRPILLVDVWEHAYYLQYQNRRAEYLDQWFELINWDAVERHFNSGTSCCGN